MITLSCLCGTVHLTLSRRPDFLNECNCQLCRKSGARWGYFSPDDVAVLGLTASYCRADKPDPGAELHFCPACGSTTHFTLTTSAVAKHGNVVCGVNLRLADEGELAGVELRFPDGATYTGEGEVPYVRGAVVL
ncbi:MAG: aldehyde-activating protein [Alteraurantiacibacter sp.]